MQIRAYVSSTLIGSAAIFLWQVVSGLLGILFLRQTLSRVMTSPGEVVPDRVGGIVAGSLLFSCASFVIVGLIYLGSGMLYAYLHARRETLTTEQGMAGGAASAASVSLVRALLGALIALFTRPMILKMMSDIAPGNMPPQGFPPGGLAFSVASGFMGACIGIVVAAVLGLAGGVVGGMLFGGDEE